MICQLRRTRVRRVRLDLVVAVRRRLAADVGFRLELAERRALRFVAGFLLLPP